MLKAQMGVMETEEWTMSWSWWCDCETLKLMFREMCVEQSMKTLLLEDIECVICHDMTQGQ